MSDQPRRRKKRKKRPRPPRAPALNVKQVLAWLDEYHALTGAWPTRLSGEIPGSLGETWYKVDKALRDGTRTLSGGSSLARLLEEWRGVRNQANLPPLTIDTILSWAGDHRHSTGRWPNQSSGPVADQPGETWANVDAALRMGLRQLPGGSSLARLLARRRGVINLADRPPLSEETILAWADAYHARRGRWPTSADGAIPRSKGDTWLAVDAALRRGARGLHGGTSLAQLLAKHRGVRNPASPPRLTETKVLAWADEHHTRTGHWPTGRSGPIGAAPEETWAAINTALRRGDRGLPGGSTLAELLVRHRGIRNNWHLPPLSEDGIWTWARAHFARTGSWPTGGSGAVHEAPEETWLGLDAALRKGRRGLPGGSSVARLLAARRGGANPGAPDQKDEG